MGISQVNYTHLHHKLADSIACFNVPLGVLGYYIYLAQHIMILYAIFDTIRTLSKYGNTATADEKLAAIKKGRTLHFLRDCLTFAFSMLFLVQACQTA